MIQRDDLGQTKARKPHQSRAAASARDVVDQLDRRAVAPVQIFGHQQQRPALGVAIEQLAHLAQHAIRADAGKLSSQRVALVAVLSHGSCSSHVGATARNSGATRAVAAA